MAVQECMPRFGRSFRPLAGTLATASPTMNAACPQVLLASVTDRAPTSALRRPAALLELAASLRAKSATCDPR